MTIRKPIVINNGQLEQLQTGDYIDIGNTKTKTNNNAGTINIGQPVYAVNASVVDLARANAQGTIRVIGLVADTTIATTASGSILVDGILVANAAQWDAVTGQTGGLTPGSNYFLDAATAGKLAISPPANSGEFVLRVGYAISSTDFEIEVQQPIKL